MRTLLIIFLIAAIQQIVLSQSKFAGTWILTRVMLDGRVQPEAIHPDTLRFTQSTLQQTMLIKVEDQEVTWIQTGKYSVHKKTLKFYDRLSSLGEPGKFYQEVSYRCKLRRNTLILSKKEKVTIPKIQTDTVTVKYSYQRLN